MNRLVQQLMLGGSTFALISVAPFITTRAVAQNVSSVDTIESVTVTGTSIRGAAPVGSSIQVVSPADLEATGASNVSSALAAVPALMFFGTADRDVTQGANGQPGISVGIHQIGAMSSATTLVLIDGHHALESGNSNYFVNPNQLPANMVERIEVLADGSSAIYGSDAVAGVVNFITRKKFNGIQIDGKASLANGTTGFSAGLLMGDSWDNGSVVFGAVYGHDTKLNATARPWAGSFQTARAAAEGLTGSGNTNFGNFNCAPATLQPTGFTNIYLNATSGVNVANTAANSPCEQFSQTVILPEEERQNAMLRFTRSFGPRLTFTADALLSHRTTENQLASGSVTATVFSTGAQANPFYIKPAGYTGTATSETIRWDSSELLPLATNTSENNDFELHAGLDYNIDDNWDVTFDVTVGQDFLGIDQTGGVNGANALLALNGTGQTGGSMTTSDIPGQSTISLNLPLTTANALDVWNPKSSNQTSAAVIYKLQDNATIGNNYFGMLDYKLGISGSPFSLWAGPVKIAAGMQVYNIGEKQVGAKGSNVGGTSVASQFYYYKFGRNDTAEYFEADIPLVSPDMNVPFMQKLELDIAGRHDHYSDPYGTNNPKFAFSWGVIDGLLVRGNMSTSFIAPSLPLRGGIQGLSSYGSVGGSTGSGNVPVAAYPLVTQFGIAGCTASSVTCSISSLQGITLAIGGAPGEQLSRPATGRTWSVGVDFAPTFLPGFSSNLTYWHVSANNLVALASNSIQLYNPSLIPLLKFYPNCATPAQYLPYTLSSTGYPAPQTSAFPACVQYVRQSLTDDDLYMRVNGLDIDAEYQFDTDDFGSFKVGSTVSQLLQFDQAWNFGGPPSSSSEYYSTLNTDGLNSGFPSLARTMRSHLGWADMGFKAEVFWNFTSAYTNALSPLNPLTANSLQQYNGGGDHVHAHSAFDLHLSYDFDGGMFGNDNLSLVVTDLLNSKPPYYNTAPGARSGGGYDLFAGNPIGRDITFSFRTKF